MLSASPWGLYRIPFSFWGQSWNNGEGPQRRNSKIKRFFVLLVVAWQYRSADERSEVFSFLGKFFD